MQEISIPVPDSASFDCERKDFILEKMAEKYWPEIQDWVPQPRDGLDCIGLVNHEGKYEQMIDHDFLQKYFEIETVSRERSPYGRNRPQFDPMK